MDILNKIVTHKRKEVEKRSASIGIEDLQRSELFDRQTFSMVEHIRDPLKSGIIAEFKRKSPSKGMINDLVKVDEVTTGYSKAGASGLSVLTDLAFFGGTSEDLTKTRSYNTCPILRKDFMIDDYQVYEAKAMGADMILLIARILERHQVKRLAALAKELGMEVLMEVHNKEELSKICDDVDILGVNNRNLETFETNIETSKKLSFTIPDGFLKISESGIHSDEDVQSLREFGFEGFLVGERFMKTEDPGTACAEFINSIHVNRK